MRILKRCLLLPLFCLSLSLSGCKNDTQEVKELFVTNVLKDFQYDDIVVERVDYGDKTVYLVKVFYKVKNMQHTYNDKLEIWVYNGNYFENVYFV